MAEAECGPAFNMNCDNCGSLCCYVDDSSYVLSSSDPRVLSEKLSEQYRKLASYMSDNRLVINDDKTHLLVMGTPRFHTAREDVDIATGTVTIEPIKTEKLLGINIHESLKWKEHILNSEKSMIKMLVTRLSHL